MAPRGAQLPPLPVICQHLQEIIHAADAARLGTFPTGGGVLVKLPVWAYVPAKIDMGRKGQNSDGTTSNMPVRIDWEGGSVRFLGFGETVEIGWRMVGLGHDESGSASVGISADTGVRIVSPPAGIVSPEWVPIRSQRLFDARVRAVVTSGHTGRWNLISGMEGYTRHRLVTTNYAVAHELGGAADADFSAVLDDIAVDELVSELLFGERNDSAVSRMIDRALEPAKFYRVDPLRYFAIAIRARAEEAIRRKIGDPKVGPKVRRVMAISGATSVEELIEAYRLLHPNDSLAHKRAIAALTAGPTVSAHQAIFRDTIVEAGAA